MQARIPKTLYGLPSRMSSSHQGWANGRVKDGWTGGRTSGESPRPTLKCWIERSSYRCDSIATMQAALLRLRGRLGSDSAYFQQVYNYAFEFSRPSGQRSLGE